MNVPPTRFEVVATSNGLSSCTIPIVKKARARLEHARGGAIQVLENTLDSPTYEEGGGSTQK